jgi:hypothetical protein
MDVNLTIDARATNRIIDIIEDIFSPATHAFGSLGDAIAFARTANAIKMAKRAKEISREHGVELPIPPLKFLVPYFEKASIEDGNSDELVESWSRLLVAAGLSYETRLVRFTSTLSEMSGEQVRILQAIATNFGGTVTDQSFELIRQDFVKYDIKKFISRLHAANHQKAFDKVLKFIKRPGVSIASLEFDVEDSCDDHYRWTADDTFSIDRRIDFEVLVSMGLLLHISTDFINLKDSSGAVHLDCYAMTELGYEFWLACSGGRSLRDENMTI